MQFIMVYGPGCLQESKIRKAGFDAEILFLSSYRKAEFPTFFKKKNKKIERVFDVIEMYDVESIISDVNVFKKKNVNTIFLFGLNCDDDSRLLKLADKTLFWPLSKNAITNYVLQETSFSGRRIVLKIVSQISKKERREDAIIVKNVDDFSRFIQ